MENIKLQTLELTHAEAFTLWWSMPRYIRTLEKDYFEKKETNGYDKEGALLEINIAKGLNEKIQKLTVLPRFPKE